MRCLLFTAVLVFGSMSLAATVGQVPANDGTPHGDPPYLLEPGWTPLITGKSFDQWRLETPQKGVWTVTPSVLWDRLSAPTRLAAMPGAGDRFVNGPNNRCSNLFTKRKFGDMELYLEFLLAEKSNSGVYLHSLYEVQVFDSFGREQLKPSDCGGIYYQYINKQDVGGTPPLVNACRRPGEWQSYHIWFRAPRFDAAGKKTENAKFLRVLLNGILIQENVEAPGPTRSHMDLPEASTNPLMLQGDHSAIAYRNIYVRPLRPLVKR